MTKSNHARVGVKFFIFFYVGSKLENHDVEITPHVIEIIERFIGPDAETPVNLPDHLTQSALTQKLTPTKTSFSAQKDAIYDLMKFDSYPR